MPDSLGVICILWVGYENGFTCVKRQNVNFFISFFFFLNGLYLNFTYVKQITMFVWKLKQVNENWTVLNTSVFFACFSKSMKIYDRKLHTLMFIIYMRILNGLELWIKPIKVQKHKYSLIVIQYHGNRLIIVQLGWVPIGVLHWMSKLERFHCILYGKQTKKEKRPGEHT